MELLLNAPVSSLKEAHYAVHQAMRFMLNRKSNCDIITARYIRLRICQLQRLMFVAGVARASHEVDLVHPIFQRLATHRSILHHSPGRRALGAALFGPFGHSHTTVTVERGDEFEMELVLRPQFIRTISDPNDFLAAEAQAWLDAFVVGLGPACELGGNNSGLVLTCSGHSMTNYLMANHTKDLLYELKMPSLSAISECMHQHDWVGAIDSRQQMQAHVVRLMTRAKDVVDQRHRLSAVVK